MKRRTKMLTSKTNSLRDETTSMDTLQNAETFQQVVEQFHQPLYRYFVVQTNGDLPCAQDMTMETFSVLYRKPVAFEKQTFSSELFGIAWDVLNAYYGCEGVGRLALVSTSLDDRADHVEIRRTLKALSTLAFYPRETLYLRIFAGLDVKDLAILMDKNTSSIKVIIHQALMEFTSQFRGAEYVLPKREQLQPASQTLHRYLEDRLRGKTPQPPMAADVAQAVERLLSLRESVSMSLESYSALVSHVEQFTSATRL